MTISSEMKRLATQCHRFKDVTPFLSILTSFGKDLIIEICFISVTEEKTRDMPGRVSGTRTISIMEPKMHCVNILHCT